MMIANDNKPCLLKHMIHCLNKHLVKEFKLDFLIDRPLHNLSPSKLGGLHKYLEWELQARRWEKAFRRAQYKKTGLLIPAIF